MGGGSPLILATQTGPNPLQEELQMGSFDDMKRCGWQNQSSQPPWLLGELVLSLCCARKPSSDHPMIETPTRTGRSAGSVSLPMAQVLWASMLWLHNRLRGFLQTASQAAATGCKEANRDNEADEAVGCHAAAMGFDGLPLPPDPGQRPPRRLQSWLAIAPVTKDPLR